MAKKRNRRRDPAPFWWSARKAYYIQIGKKQHRLGEDLDAAKKMARKLLDATEDANSRRIEVNFVGASEKLVVEILDDFVTWTEANRSQATKDAYKARLAHVVASLRDNGDETLTVERLKPHHISCVISAHPEWSANYRGDVVRAVERALNWAVEQGLIDRNPIAGIKKPGRKARELVISPKEFEILLSKVKYKALRDLLELAWETGLRVQELRKLQAKYIDLERRVIVFTIQDSKGQKKNRVAYLGTDRGVEILRDWMTRYPDGPVMRNRSGRPWTKDAINSAFVRMKERLGVKYHLGALRKSFATEALKNGVDAVTVAHLMGHSDTTMIARFYGHVQQDVEHMTRAAKRARGKGLS